MGNTGKAFLTALLTLILPVLIFVNLLAFSNLFGFGEIQQSGDVYFGYTTFINSIQLLGKYQEEFGAYQYMPDRWYDFTRDVMNTSLFGFPRFVRAIVNGDLVFKIDFDLSKFPNTSLPTFESFNDILSFFVAYQHWINALWQMVIDFISWFTGSLYGYYELFVFYVNFICWPAILLIYVGYLLGFVFEWIGIIALWLLSLMTGSMYTRMPSNNYSSWQDIADDWMDEWSSLPTSSAKVLFAPFVARLHGGTRGDILAI